MSKRTIDFGSSSDENSDTGCIRERQHSSRKISKPLRLGSSDSEHRLNLLSSDDSHEEPFGAGDTSDEYVPSPKQRKKSQQSRTTVRHNFIAHQLNHENTNQCENIIENSNATQKINFDSQFDRLNSDTQFDDELSAVYTMTKEINTAMNVENDNFIAESSQQPERSKIGASVVNATEPEQSNEMNGIDSTSFHKIIIEKLNEIVSRLATLEKRVIPMETTLNERLSGGDGKSNGLRRVKDQIHVEAELFIKSNSLPTKNIGELQRFEANLGDPIFYTAAVSSF